MSSSAELIEQMNKLRREADKIEAQIEQAKKEEKLTAIADIRNKMNAYGITVEEIQNAPQIKIKVPKKPRSNSEAKYSDGQGNFWSGHGRKPQWMINALAAGKSKEDYRI